MSKGFLDANIDVGLLADPKLLKLVTLIPNEGERACTIVVYVQTVLQSWHDGHRLSVEEAEGLWEPTPYRIDALVAAKLIDADHRIPESAWENHYGPALRRSKRRAEAGRKGGRKSAGLRKQRSSDASTPLQRRSGDGEAKPDLTPADPPSPEGEAGGVRPGHRVRDAPARPPIHMGRLHEVDTNDLEVMLRGLPQADGRRHRLKAEIDARQAADPGATHDLTAALAESGAT